MYSPPLWLRLGTINATLSKSEKERGILFFRLGSAWGDISGFWCGRSNFHAVKESDGVLQGQYSPQVELWVADSEFDLCAPPTGYAQIIPLIIAPKFLYFREYPKETRLMIERRKKDPKAVWLL
ncbi:hypothetical protein SLEP1_g26175 [Rubroshorea leprosula]|uniref:Uncharacterized protein n=1 Tax=Rubroshorea leprosula TaxID=152421 RepID=A0AAV5JVJ9_9ROSI|nr:hypothetical protein SLEP1_g26175 [Rubroshorea leprosula]